jgi:hypothetical protein
MSGDVWKQKVIVHICSNGLGYRNAWKCDNDSDADVDANDKKRCFAYDGPRRQVATYCETDTTPKDKEEFFHHAAGADGMGGFQYLRFTCTGTFAISWIVSAPWWSKAHFLLLLNHWI